MLPNCLSRRTGCMQHAYGGTRQANGSGLFPKTVKVCVRTGRWPR